MCSKRKTSLHSHAKRGTDQNQLLKSCSHMGTLGGKRLRWKSKKSENKQNILRRIRTNSGRWTIFFSKIWFFTCFFGDVTVEFKGLSEISSMKSLPKFLLDSPIAQFAHLCQRAKIQHRLAESLCFYDPKNLTFLVNL